MPNDTERLLGELSEFKRVALSEFAELKEELANTKRDVKELLAFKWRATGVMGFLLTTAEMVRLAWENTRHLK